MQEKEEKRSKVCKKKKKSAAKYAGKEGKAGKAFYEVCNGQHGNVMKYARKRIKREKHVEANQ